MTQNTIYVLASFISQDKLEHILILQHKNVKQKSSEEYFHVFIHDLTFFPTLTEETRNVHYVLHCI